MRISLVIPAYNEHVLLPRLLDTLDFARVHLTPLGELEVIVADNGSTDETTALAEARGCRVVHEPVRRIGAVRNAGAQVATGDLLAFVDADMQVHPHTLLAIHRALSTPKIIAGATGVRLERWSLGLVVTFAMMVPLLWLTKMDTGVVFCRRVDFEAIGGYNDQMSCAEDVDFLWRLRALGQTRGQHLYRATSVKALACTRKFDEHGDWHYFKMVALACAWVLGVKKPLTRFAQAYWYGDQRPQR